MARRRQGIAGAGDHFTSATLTLINARVRRGRFRRVCRIEFRVGTVTQVMRVFVLCHQFRGFVAILSSSGPVRKVGEFRHSPAPFDTGIGESREKFANFVRSIS
jgi:hypothetical protein